MLVEVKTVNVNLKLCDLAVLLEKNPIHIFFCFHRARESAKSPGFRGDHRQLQSVLDGCTRGCGEVQAHIRPNQRRPPNARDDHCRPRDHHRPAAALAHHHVSC